MNNYLSRIPPDWFMSSGKGACVAICDIGIDITHPALRHVSEHAMFGGTRPSGHGTGVVSIIAGRPKTVAYRGLATAARVVAADIPFGTWSDYAFLCQALDWVKGQKPDVLNLSIAYANESAEIRGKLEEIASNGTVIVSAHALHWKYPHQYPFVVAVTCAEELTDDVDLVAPGEFVVEDKEGKPVTLYGSSMASAFVSSVATLARANDAKMGREQFLQMVSGSTPFTLRRMWPGAGREQVNLAFG
jgi:subtilisin family serine protease